MGVLADELIDRIAATRRWPMAEEAAVWKDIVKWIAYRENDRELLKGEAAWQGDARYKIDPLPERISGAFGTLLFGREPIVKAADKADQERLAEILRLNKWGSRLRTAEEKCSSEGEVWWRLVADNVRHDAPMLTWHSRIDVIPHYVNQQLRAVAFVNELTDNLDGTDADSLVYRHFEIHDPESVTNVLFRGEQTNIGIQVDLAEHDSVEGLADEWVHDLGLLAGRIVNVEGQDPEIGKSDYDGIEDWFLELNECLSTGSANRDLTALKRIYAPRDALDEQGNLPAGKNVIATDQSDQQWGSEGPKGQFGTLELSFDADALIKWQNQVAMTAASRRGLTAQFIALPTDSTDGGASTGVALRVRLIPSKAEGDRRSGPWKDDADGILLRIQKLDALPREQRGFASTWTKPDEAPSVQLSDPLPIDGVEEATRLSTLRTASLISIRQSLIEQHPDWSDERIDEELELIKEDRAAEGASQLPFGKAPGAPGDPPAAGDDVALPEGEGEVTIVSRADAFEVSGLAGP